MQPGLTASCFEQLCPEKITSFVLRCLKDCEFLVPSSKNFGTLPIEFTHLKYFSRIDGTIFKQVLASCAP